jgi:hypothetical protein
MRDPAWLPSHPLQLRNAMYHLRQCKTPELKQFCIPQTEGANPSNADNHAPTHNPNPQHTGSSANWSEPGQTNHQAAD